MAISLPSIKTKRHIGVGHFQATDRMRELVSQVLDSGRVSYGPLSLEFEQRFAAMHGCKYGILSNSGTSSLQVALQAMKELHGWQSGDRVIVPATTFVATANIVLHNRMIPTLVDVDPHTYNINPALIEPSLTTNTRAIIPVSLFGQPANLSEVQRIADRHGLRVIHDSCETMFANHRGKNAAQWADISVYSTYVAHLLVTGVGGLALTDNPDYAATMRSLVNHGLALDCLNPGANFSPQPAPGRRFRFDSIGHSYRISEFEAALGLAQLDDVSHMLGARRRNANHLTAGLNNINNHYRRVFQLPTIEPENDCVWMMYPIVLLDGDKEDLMAHLNRYGIETRDMLPLINQPAYRYLAQTGAYPVSLNIIERGLYVGIHQGLTEDDIRFMVDCFGVWVDPEYPGVYL